MPGRKLVKIRGQKFKMKSRPGKSYRSYHLSVPPDIAKKIPEAMRFTVELTNDGILFRPHKEPDPVPPPQPAWLTDASRPATG
jgi:hypothetical protein